MDGVNRVWPGFFPLFFSCLQPPASKGLEVLERGELVLSEGCPESTGDSLSMMRLRTIGLVLNG